MLKNNGVVGADWLTLNVLTHTTRGLNSPIGIVGLPMVDRDFLVARVACESHRSHRQTVQVKLSVTKLGQGAESDVLSVSDLFICAVVCVLEDED